MAATSFYGLSAVDINGEELSFEAFQNKVCLITNVACRCGRTRSSYRAIKGMIETYGAEGDFAVLLFPCNQFGRQEPGSEAEIRAFVEGLGLAVAPPLYMFSKISVSGEQQHPVYRYLLSETDEGAAPGWNFDSWFVVSKAGVPVYAGSTAQEAEEDVQAALQQD